MYDWAVALSLILSVGLSAYLATIFIGNLLQRNNRASRGNTEIESLRRKIEAIRVSMQQSFSTTQMLLAINQFIRLVYTLFDLVPLTFSVLTMLFVHRKIYVFAFLLLLFSNFLMHNTDLALGSVEQFYQCVLSPFLNNYLFSFMHLMNLFWGALVPVLNVFVVMLRQFLVGSALVLTKCQSSSLTLANVVTGTVDIFKASISETLRFYGLLDGINGQNNFAVNTMRWERIVEPTRKLLQFFPESLTCLCAGNSGFLRYFWNFAFSPLFGDEIDMIISHALNFFVAWIQVLLQTLPPFLSYPNFSKAFFHLVALSVEVGRLFDKWFVELLQLVTKLFKIGGFNVIIEVPELFLFGTIARLIAFYVVLVEKIVDIVQHLLLPFDERPITDTAFMQDVFSMKKPLAYFDAFLVSASSSLHFTTSTVVKVFVLVSAMSSDGGCPQYPNSCHYYDRGSCAVYCQSKSTIVFQQNALRCPYEVNARARYEFNLDAIESLDRKVFAALDAFQGGFVTLQSTRSCVPEWDRTYTYRHAEMVSYEGRAYFCKSSRCFFTNLQQQYPDTECGSLVTCWEEILYGDDALRACPTVLNQTLASTTFSECQQWCNETASCRAFEHFDKDKYKAERETLTKQCESTMKCDFPQCTLFKEAFDNVNLYLRQERSPTALARTQLSLGYVYAQEGARIRNNTYTAYCDVKQEESIYCTSLVDGIGLERVAQFEAYNGKKDAYYTFAYKSDLFSTEQETFLPLQREILSVAVQKTVNDRFTFEFSRRNTRNQSDVLGMPLHGKDVTGNNFRLGIVRDTYKDLFAPDDSFSVDTFLSCTGLSFVRVPTNAIFIFYEFLNELLWKLIIGGSIRATELNGNTEQLFLMRFFRLMYKYDGGWFSRDEESSCSPPLPLSAARLTVQDYNGIAYDPYCNAAPTLQTHVYLNWDKMAFFSTSVFQRDSFGKLLFNLLRFVPEAYRVFGRMVIDLQSARVVERLALLPFGCGFSYGENKTGDCTSILSTENTLKPPCPIGFPSKDCSCRVEDPLLDIDTTCACIWLPSSTLDQDLRQTTNVAVSHWCGVNMLEWTLIYFSRITDAMKLILDSMQTGATNFPVNPDLCDVDEKDQFTRGGKSYQLLDSLINRVFGGVVTRNFLTDEVSTCEITATHDFACSFASVLERTVKLMLGMVRKVWRNSVAVISFQVEAVDIDLSTEICGLEQTQAALASSIVEISPGLSQESLATRKGITALIYSFMDILGVLFSEVHLALLFVRSFLSGNPDIIDGGAMGSESAQNAVSTADTTTIFYAAMTKFVVVWSTFVKQVFESLAKIGSRDLFLQLRDIVSFLEQLITGGIIPVLAQMAYLVVRVLGLMFTPHLIDGQTMIDIVTDILDLAGEFINLLLSQAMRVLGLILDMMGTFGQLIGSLLKLICNIQSVLSRLTFGAWEELDCSALPSFRRRALEEEDILRQAFDAFEWTGDNFCDHFMHAYKDWEGGFSHLRPIEQLRMVECVEWRMLSEQVINITGLKSLPHDFLYNWKQPPMLLAKGMQAGFLYAKWWLKDGKNIAALKQTLQQSGLPANDILSSVAHVKRIMQNTVTRSNAHTLVMNVFRDNDPRFLDPNSTSSTTNAYHVYSAVSQSVYGLYDILFSDEFSRNLKSLERFHLPSYRTDQLTMTMPTSKHIFSKRALQLQRQAATVQQSFGRVYSALECQQTSDEKLFCFECALVDNFLYTSLGVAEQLGLYFENQFRTDFLDLFNASWTDNTVYNQKYIRAFRAAQAKNQERYGAAASIQATPPNEWLAYALGLAFYRNRSFEELTLAVNYWFQGNESGEVPFNATLLFPETFQTVIEAPFQADCTTASFLWHEKVRSPTLGFVPGLASFAAFELYLFFVSDLPLFAKTVAYLSLSVVSFVGYLMVVYEMNPFCLPQLPVYLLRDLLLWMEEALFVSCSCTWFPFLSQDCTQQTCYSCTSESPNYFTCTEHASGMKELGMLWHFAFFARWQFRETVAWVNNLNIFPFTFLQDIEGLNLLLEQASNNEAVKGLDLDCFWLGILIPIAQSILVAAVFMTFSAILTWALLVAQHCLLFVYHLVASTVYLAYAASSS